MNLIDEDLSASLAAISTMAEWLERDRDQLTRIWTDPGVIYGASGSIAGNWTQVYLFTAHETAKLLIAARDLVIIDGLPYWEQDVMDAQDAMPYNYRTHSRRQPNWLEFAEETMTAAGEFNMGEEMDTLVAALIKAGAREIA